MSGSDSHFVIENNVLIRYTGPKDAAINIPDGVTAINSFVFRECTGLITIPSGVTTIDKFAFYNSNLTTIPDGVTTIGMSAFSCCSSLTAIPISVTTMDLYAFSHCRSLESCELNSTVSIKENSFKYCLNLKYIFIVDDQVERIKDILPADQKHLVFGRSSEAYKLYMLDNGHDTKISQMILDAYQPKLDKIDIPDPLSGVFAFLNQEDITAVALTNKFNASLLKRLNAVEKPGRPLSYSSVEEYEVAMGIYTAALEKVFCSELLETKTVLTAGARAGAGAGVSKCLIC